VAAADEHYSGLQGDLSGLARSYGYGVVNVLGSASGRPSRLPVSTLRQVRRWDLIAEDRPGRWG
jgi:hypothetical protein